MLTERNPVINGYIPESEEPKITPQYWVRIEDVRPEDINAIIKVYTEAKKIPASSLYEVPSFADFKSNLVLSNSVGYIEWELRHRVNVLEVRRRINEAGSVFVRFKIASLREGNEMYLDTPEGKHIQNGIDKIFNERGVAINLPDLFKPAKRLIA